MRIEDFRMLPLHTPLITRKGSSNRLQGSHSVPSSARRNGSGKYSSGANRSTWLLVAGVFCCFLFAAWRSRVSRHGTVFLGQWISGDRYPLDAPGLPKDFDPEAYLQYHPDLALEGVLTETDAAKHYMAHGRPQGRLGKRTKVIIRYIACTGLINQHYSHIAAFSLAAVLGAELVLPPAVCRDSFGHYFSVFKEKNEVLWSPVPLDSLLDLDKIISFWKTQGMAVHRAPSLTPFPDLTQPDIAFPMYEQPELNSELITRLGGIYLKAMDMAELVSASREVVVAHAATLLKKDPDRDIPYIVIDLPCTFFSLRSVSSLRIVSEVARSLEFPKLLHAMAQRIIDGMTQHGTHSYNGVHLRVEKDAKDWAMIMGGPQIVWLGYIKTMRETHFNATERIYVASGLMTYGASVDMSRTVEYLKLMQVASEVHHKERYIPREELEMLNSEQKALLDFLVLARAHNFVGFGSSTFSFYLREYRALQGIPRRTSGLVDASIIGTDPLFHSAGTII